MPQRIVSSLGREAYGGDGLKLVMIRLTTRPHRHRGMYTHVTAFNTKWSACNNNNNQFQQLVAEYAGSRGVAEDCLHGGTAN